MKFYFLKEYLVLLDNINGNTLGVNNKKKKIDIPLNQGIWWYEAYGGNCSKGEFQASGAYALRTKGERHRVQDKEMLLKSYILTVSCDWHDNHLLAKFFNGLVLQSKI